ncbi:MAG: mannose-6-phosphate isomerase, class I [Deltaproteobacteria bacterium]|nr:mannose-6-phosphate isomerase, class I [Deltaproteobacteria bacterium]MBW2043869.1 mannose-6-phosphate isomerase, class I [Deltaproteobacteria bacterium]MBW2300042.1 mannose-6-phosphate isomerase, class I [Deltaproteobacteria bacterium]
MSRIAPLKNRIQQYGWGSRVFIPDLLGLQTPAQKPQAELWMGTHPNGPSMVFWNRGWKPLPDVVAQDPEGILGKVVARKFSSQLPFLFKVLAADRPLSIQAHPDQEQARRGFERENQLKIPLNSPRRNYKDKNHKPEILCALTPFWALKGFRDIEEILVTVDKLGCRALSELTAPLRARSRSESLREFFASLMMMGHNEQEKVLSDVVQSIKANRGGDPVLEWALKLSRDFPGDIGALSPLFLNLLLLEPGEAIYLPAGELHAYLKGAGIELMANSDNVLRGGLTSKHVDVEELLRVLSFSSGKARIQRPEKLRDGEWAYRVPAKEFMLSVIAPGKGSFKSPEKRSVEIMICTKGNAWITDFETGQKISLKRGGSFLVPASIRQYQIMGESMIYKAAVPLF